jgi:hypothetical protein
VVAVEMKLKKISLTAQYQPKKSDQVHDLHHRSVTNL